MAGEGLVAASSRHAPVQRDRFRVRVALSPDALWERVLAHPKVRVSDEPAPEPAPPEGAPFLAARQSPTELRLRHWAGPADAASPVIIMELRPDGHGGTIVEGRFEKRHRQRLLVDFPRVRRGGTGWIVAGLVATLLSLVLLTPVLVGSPAKFVVSVVVLLFFFTVPTALVFIPGLLIWNAEGRKQLLPPLWELIGELMTPIALPEVDTDRPFRGHALPSARE